MTELAITEPLKDHPKPFISWVIRMESGKREKWIAYKDKRMHNEDRAKSGKMLSEVPETVYTL